MSEFSLNDLRQYAIKNRTTIACRVRAADQTAVVEENGVIKIPGVSGRPPYTVEEVAARADEFTLTDREKKSRTLSRPEFLNELKPPKPAPAGKPAAEGKAAAAGKPTGAGKKE